MRKHTLALGLVAASAMMAAAPVAEARDDPDQKPNGPDGIPDRVSLETDSPYYFPHWRHLGVRFNGGESVSVVEFCVSEGWCRTHLWTGSKPRMERGRYVTVTRRGTIEPYWRSRP